MIVFDEQVTNQKVYDYISTVNMCERFGSLPYEGGLYDQDFWVVHHMMIVMGLQAERQDKENKRREAEAKRKQK